MKKAKIAGLPKGVGVGRVVNGRGTKYWRVRLGKRFTGGPVVLKDFALLEEAREWIFGEEAQKQKSTPPPQVELKRNLGKAVFSLSPVELGETLAGLKKLDTMGIGLTQAIELAKKVIPPSAGTMSLKEAIKRCGDEKEKLNRSVYTLYALKTRWKRFAKFLPAQKAKTVHTILREDVERFVSSCKLGPVGERNMVRALSSLFSWCVEKKVMAVNPVLNWNFAEARKVLSQDRSPRILTIREAEKILRVAVAGCAKPMIVGKQSIIIQPGEMVPFVVLGLFAGMRPFETRRMRWEWVWWGDVKTENHEPHLDVPAGITKTRSGRTIPIEPVLAEWLLPHKRDGGLMIPIAFERKFAMFSKLCWDEDGWPEDVLRHSYASYLLARDKNSGAVAENLGHQNNTSTLFRYYRKAVKFKTDVVAYWGLTPQHIKTSKLVKAA
ncbi:MAG: tyrosine-type recombinase/integrase [Chthoniobacterales bacterium]